MSLARKSNSPGTLIKSARAYLYFCELFLCCLALFLASFGLLWFFASDIWIFSICSFTLFILFSCLWQNLSSYFTLLWIFKQCLLIHFVNFIFFTFVIDFILCVDFQFFMDHQWWHQFTFNFKIMDTQICNSDDEVTGNGKELGNLSRFN